MHSCALVFNRSVVAAALLLLFSLSFISAKFSYNGIKSNMDTSVDPCQDFYNFACGSWIKKTKEYNQPLALEMLDEHKAKLLHSFLTSDKVSPFLSKFYHTCIDVQKIESDGVPFIQRHFSEFDALAKEGKISSIVGFLHSIGVKSVWEFSVDVDKKRPTQYLAELSQGSSNLASGEFYLSVSRRAEENKQAYIQLASEFFSFLNMPNARQMATDAVDVEVQLISLSEPGFDDTTVYNRITLKQLDQVTKGLFNWNDYLEALSVSTSEFNMEQPDYFDAIVPLLESKNQDKLLSYLKLSFLVAIAEHLPSKFRDVYHSFLETLKQQQLSWKRSSVCVDSMKRYLGYAVSKEFMNQIFDKESKDRVTHLAANIKNTFRRGLASSKSMDASTKQAALRKLEALEIAVGYPEKWPEQNINVGDVFLDSFIAARQSRTGLMLDNLGKTVDRVDWLGAPPEDSNAYNSISTNAIVLPGGYLEAPLFDKNYPDMLNYARIGAVIGHEISHSFDQKGKFYNEIGLLTNWWSPQSEANYEEKQKCFEQQYSAYEATPGTFLNGKLSFGENIADNLGVQAAYAAFSEMAGSHFQDTSPISYLSNQQLFFVMFAQKYCSKDTPDHLRIMATTQVHSPPQFRVIGPISNMPEFGAAFKCPLGSKMNPTKKCEMF